MDHAAGVRRHVGVVRDHDDRDAGPGIELHQQFHHFTAARGIEVARRLVREQHRGRCDDGPGDGHALLLPSRQFAGRVVLPSGETHRRQGFPGQPVARRRTLAAVQQRQLDVFLRRRAGQQVEALEHEADVLAAQARPLVAGEAFDMNAAKYVFAARRRVEAAKDVHHRRLAGSARAHHRHELALRNIEIDAVQRIQRGLALAVDARDAARAGSAPNRRAPPARLPSATGIAPPAPPASGPVSRRLHYEPAAAR